MFRVVNGTTQNLADVDAFVGIVNGAEGQALFEGDEVIVTRAPGRLDVMGGIADYSGSLVLEMPIKEATCVALQKDDSGVLRIVSLGSDENGRAPNFDMSLSELMEMDYTQARDYFRQDASRSWAAYVAGVFLVLKREKNVNFDGGMRLLIASDVPEGKGVSSSAAIEVATMQAVAVACGVDIAPRELAILCQMVENLVVGAPCGVMDQMTSACARENELLALLCQPAELQNPVPVPDDVTFWGLDSGIRHAVSGADYGSVRVGAFMGYRIISDFAGFKVEVGEQVVVEDPVWQGYLANVTPSVFDQFYAQTLPEKMRGDAFLGKYGGTTDVITTVDTTREYAVRMPTRHPIYEHFRVETFRQILPEAKDGNALRILGELMYQAHASYSACGLGSVGTDRLVELVREKGIQTGLYGAKITGGGSGGTVAVLGKKSAEKHIHDIAAQYAEETGFNPYIFAGSSPGACDFGHLILQKG